MRTFDDEQFVLEMYRMFPFNGIKINGRLLKCMRVDRLTRSRLYSRSWVNSSAKNDLPPDFHNNKHRIMLEVMRVDDCVNTLKGKHVVNSFERTNAFLKNKVGYDYKKSRNCSLFFVPDTRDSEEFNFRGYLANFEKVINKHSGKVSKYRKNYPKCKTVVFFVCDESNNYIQVTDKADLKREDEPNVVIKNFRPHCYFDDAKFIEIIKNCQADYLIWFRRFKYVFINNQPFNYPNVCIYDVKHIKHKGLTYNHDLMFKVKEEQTNESIQRNSGK